MCAKMCDLLIAPNNMLLVYDEKTQIFELKNSSNEY